MVRLFNGGSNSVVMILHLKFPLLMNPIVCQHLNNVELCSAMLCAEPSRSFRHASVDIQDRIHAIDSGNANTI